MNEMDGRQNIEGYVFLVLFCLTIPAANWLIGHVGTVMRSQLVRVWCRVAPGIMAPSGVLMIGLALVLRDLVQRRLGVGIRHRRDHCRARRSRPGSHRRHWCVASAAAFLLSEFADFAVYTPLARRRLVVAVIASSVVGLVVDFIVFLWLAFGSLEFLIGQIIGKLWMVLLAIPFVMYMRRRDERIGLKAA